MVFLIAKKTGHSFSPLIHKELGRYEYETKELEEHELDDFFKKREFSGLNVTIPYKTTVMKYLDFISPEAERIGAVNTIVNRGGRLFGYNTDSYGFAYTLKNSKIELSGKDVLVIGSGGASKAVVDAFTGFDVKRVRVLTHKDNCPEKIGEFLDAEIIVNTTPVGMFPNVDDSPVELSKFKNALAVFDVIFNPLKTRLLLDARELGIPCFNGLEMLVAQAKMGCEHFTSKKVDDGEIKRICSKLHSMVRNIVLIGMPGCGKSSVGRLLASELQRELLDTDEFISKNKKPPAEIIERFGEAEFRRIECEAVKECGKRSGVVIATGGGVVTRDENLESLIRNDGIIFFIDRPIELLATKGRPLSVGGEERLRSLYDARIEKYRAFAHFIVDGSGSINDVKSRITAIIKELM